MARFGWLLLLLLIPLTASGEILQRVVDIPTRSGVTERLLLVAPENPKAVALVFPGSDGGLQIGEEGAARSGRFSFLFRTRRLFALEGIMVAVFDAPSDRQGAPFLAGFRLTPQHLVDIRTAIGWLRRETNLPVWLMGTSRGTLSAAFAATALAGSTDGPDGLVLLSSILTGDSSATVQEMALERITVPVLVVHHRRDRCFLCPYEKLPHLMAKLSGSRRKELLTFHGGEDGVEGCNGLAFHGFNGIDHEVVHAIAVWMTEERKESRKWKVPAEGKSQKAGCLGPVS